MLTAHIKGTVILSCALGMLACNGKDAPTPSPASDARTSDSASDVAAADVRSSATADTAQPEAPVDALVGVDQARDVPWRGYTACIDIGITDPEEALAKVPQMPCVGCLECNFGPRLTVCGRLFGSTVKCTCGNDVMSCSDQRPKAMAEEASQLQIDGGELCPSPSWPHDAAMDD